jgi:hypothetical protein
MLEGEKMVYTNNGRGDSQSSQTSDIRKPLFIQVSNEKEKYKSYWLNKDMDRKLNDGWGLGQAIKTLSQSGISPQDVLQFFPDCDYELLCKASIIWDSKQPVPDKVARERSHFSEESRMQRIEKLSDSRITGQIEQFVEMINRDPKNIQLILYKLFPNTKPTLDEYIDHTEMGRIYKAAADNGSNEAQHRLAELIRDVFPDEADTYCSQASETDNPEIILQIIHEKASRKESYIPELIKLIKIRNPYAVRLLSSLKAEMYSDQIIDNIFEAVNSVANVDKVYSTAVRAAFHEIIWRLTETTSNAIKRKKNEYEEMLNNRPKYERNSEYYSAYHHKIQRLEDEIERPPTIFDSVAPQHYARAEEHRQAAIDAYLEFASLNQSYYNLNPDSCIKSAKNLGYVPESESDPKFGVLHRIVPYNEIENFAKAHFSDCGQLKETIDYIEKTPNLKYADTLLRSAYYVLFKSLCSLSGKLYYFRVGRFYEDPKKNELIDLPAVEMSNEDILAIGELMFSKGQSYYYFARAFFYEGILRNEVRCSEYFAYMCDKKLGEIDVEVGYDYSEMKHIAIGSEKSAIEWYFESAKLGSEKSKKTLKKLIEEGDFEAMRFKNDPIML